MFPSNGSMTRHPLPSTGSAGSVPPLHGYYGVLRFPAVLSVPLRFLRRTVTAPRACVRSDQARRRPGARGVTVRPPPTKPVVVETETVGHPKFLGNPSCAYALFSDPGGTGRTRPLQCADVAPASHHHEGSPREVISGLNRTASARAVYASPGGSPHRTQDSLLVARPSSTRRDSDPRDSYERFPRCRLHQFPLSQASWRRMRPLFPSGPSP